MNRNAFFLKSFECEIEDFKGDLASRTEIPQNVKSLISKNISKNVKSLISKEISHSKKRFGVNLDFYHRSVKSSLILQNPNSKKMNKIKEHFKISQKSNISHTFVPSKY